MLPMALILAGLALSVRDVVPQPHPPGSIEDISKLSERDDINILFLLVDTLRADRLSGHGYSRPTSPTIDALGDTGVRFSRHLAQSSWTKASMASLWTGTYPIRTGILRFNDALPEAAPMPAEILRDHGMETAGIWRNGWVAANFGFAQGFGLYHKPAYGTLKAAHRRDTPTSRIAGSDQDVTASALEFLRLHGHRQWFLYLHYMDVHQYLSDESSALFGTSYSDIYDNSIHWVDRQIQILLDGLENAGVREKTLIVLASDHGEAFGEHQREGHARDLYGEVTQTPFVLNFPFRLTPGIVVDVPSQNVDIWPTLFDLLGMPALPQSDGRSLLPEILEAALGRRSDIEAATVPSSFAHLDLTWGRAEEEPRPIVATTNYPYRLIYHPGDSARNELYDLSTDPREQENILEPNLEIARRIQLEAEAYLAMPRSDWAEEVKTVELDDMMIGQLRAIGYAIE